MRPRRHPANSDDTEARERTAPVPGLISDVTCQNRVRRALGPRVNVFIAEQFAYALSLDVATRHGLRPGKWVDEELAALILREDREAGALLTAHQFLAFRPRSRAEVARRLEEEGVTPETLDRVLLVLEEAGHLSDARFAAQWVEGRTLSRPKGSQALRQELRAKGVDKVEIEAALPDGEVELENAMVALAPFWRKSAGLESRERRYKAMQFLGRRGYTPGVAREAVVCVEADADTR